MTNEHVSRVAIYFGPNEEPAGVQVRMSDRAYRRLRDALAGSDVPDRSGGLVILDRAQAQKVARWSGRCSPASSPDYEVTHAFYNCLVGGFFNRFWEDGLNGAEAEQEWY